MRDIDVSSVLESVLSSSSCFRTLDGVSPLLDARGLPEFYTQLGVVTLFVEKDTKSYAMKCFVDGGEDMSNRAKVISEHIAGIESRYLTDYRYFKDEMLVFDRNDRAVLCDIAMQEMPLGVTLHQKIGEWCDGIGVDDIDAVYVNMVEMVKYLRGVSFTHNSISPRSIIIAEDNNPVLINYETATPLVSDGDSVAMTTLSVLMIVAKFAPDALKRLLNGRDTYNDGVFGLCRAIAESDIDESGFELLKEMTVEVVDKRDMLRDCDLLYSKLLSLIRLDSSLDGSCLDKVVSSLCLDDGSGVEIEEFKEWSTITTPEGEYIVNQSGVRIAGPFDYIGELYNGVSTVEIAGRFGAVCRSGEVIMKPIYSDINIDAEANVVIAQKDDSLWAIFSCGGRQITPFQFEELFTSSCGLLQAKMNGKYGFISPSGNVCINFIYDQLFSFNSKGEAEAFIDQTKLYINTKGQIVGRD